MRLQEVQLKAHLKSSLISRRLAQWTKYFPGKLEDMSLGPQYSRKNLSGAMLAWSSTLGGEDSVARYCQRTQVK